LSKNVYKGGFVQFSPENTKIIDTNSLVAKKMEMYSTLLREKDEEEYVQPSDSEDGLLDEQLSALTDSGESPESPQEPVYDAEEIRKACDDMIKEANSQASLVLTAAQKEAEEIKKNALEQGRQEGFEIGKTEAQAILKEEAEKLAEEKERLYSEYEEMKKNLEPKMVDVISDVYAKVFGNGFFNKKDVLVTLISKALSDAEADDKIIIHVSADDYEEVVSASPELFSKVSFSTEPEIRQRESLSSGQAKVETTYGIMDCGIDTELNELTKTLKILAYEGR